MKHCTNCGAEITCGCQERVASNGVQVCSNCIALYEQSLIQVTIPNPPTTLNENTFTQ